MKNFRGFLAAAAILALAGPASTGLPANAQQYVELPSDSVQADTEIHFFTIDKDGNFSEFNPKDLPGYSEISVPLSENLPDKTVIVKKNLKTKVVTIFKKVVSGGKVILREAAHAAAVTIVEAMLLAGFGMMDIAILSAFF